MDTEQWASAGERSTPIGRLVIFDTPVIFGHHAIETAIQEELRPAAAEGSSRPGR
jgi:hypothetical protein